MQEMPKFTPGQSGNPAGKRPGTGRSIKFRRALEKQTPDVLAAVVQAAIKGDMVAARLIMDRTCPPLRPVDAPVRFVDVGSEDPAAQVRSVTSAMFAGQIGADVAASLLAALAHGQKTVEIDTFEKRIRALEQRMGVAPAPADSAAPATNRMNGNGIGHAD